MAALNQLDPFLFHKTCGFFSLRSSRDLLTNTRGSSLVSIIETCSKVLLNGRSSSDFPEDFTFLGAKGLSIVDLIWYSFNGMFSFYDLLVLDLPTFSNHLPVLLNLNDSVINNKRKVENVANRFVFDLNKAVTFAFPMALREGVGALNQDVNELNFILINKILCVAEDLGMSIMGYSANFVKRKPCFDSVGRDAKKRV